MKFNGVKKERPYIKNIDYNCKNLTYIKKRRVIIGEIGRPEK